MGRSIAECPIREAAQPGSARLQRLRPTVAVNVPRLLLILPAIGTFLVAPSTPAVAQGTWTATSRTGAPTGRWRHTAVWTGSRMIVWARARTAAARARTCRAG